MRLLDQKDARSLLEKAGVFIEPDEDGPDTSQVLNMSIEYGEAEREHRE